MRNRVLPFVAAILAFALAGNVFAADPVVMTLHNVDERIGSMTVNFTVTDDTGQESTLAPETTRVTLDGKQLNVTSIEKTSYGRQPASIVLLVDTSGSMYGEPIVQAQAAVRDFIAQMEPDDRIALMSFSTDVRLLQDYTTDRSLLDGAVSSLEAFGDTALFAAVNAAVEKSNEAPDGGKLIVLLSDGVATEGIDNREASLAVAEQAGTRIIAVGLGPSLDVDYLRALSERTGGRYVPTASAAQLRQTYSDIAKTVVHRYFSDYTMEVDVPPTIDRTIDGTLKIETSVRSAAISSEVGLGPLEGAVPPPYEVRITGVPVGGELKEAATVGVSAPQGRNIVSIEYLVDDEIVATATEAAGTYELAPNVLETGTYKLSVRTLDEKGGEGYGELSFLVPPPVAAPPPPQPESGRFPIMIVILGLMGVGIVFALYRLVQKRLDLSPEYMVRSLNPEPGESLEQATAAGATDNRPARARAAALGRSRGRYRGRIVVMRESAILAGDLHTTREYELADAPLTIGTGRHCDIQLEDESGLIADEEARVWIQRGRITYHRLTALSAMATTGVTPGWEFFDNGNELRVGAYRFVFQVQVNEEQALSDDLPASALPQEHGMTLRPSEPFGWDNR